MNAKILDDIIDYIEKTKDNDAYYHFDIGIRPGESKHFCVCHEDIENLKDISALVRVHRASFKMSLINSEQNNHK